MIKIKNNLKIIITGGSGFIGSYLATKLKKEHDVTIFDVKQNVADIDFIEGDVTNLDNVKKSITNCDLVIHLAAALGVVNVERDPVRTLDVNLGGTKNVLDACRANNIKKIMFSSSSEVYGEPVKVPIEETDKVIPITTYGVSKFGAEEYIKAYSKNYGIEYTIFRLFNVYGAMQATDWVLPEFVDKAILNQQISVHGDGSQVRAFCYVSDVADAFQSALTTANGEIINIGNNTSPISIKELGEKIISLTNSKSNIKFIPFEESKRNRTEIMKRIPDIGKAKRVLNYSPKISLDEGIQKIIKYRKEISVSK